MFTGSLINIFITSAAGQPMQDIEQVRAVPGKGLEGDRYYTHSGQYSEKPGSGRQVTLIEIEALEAMEAETGLELTAAEARRNLVTRGVPLNQLVDKQFQVGDVILRGMRLCEPCTYLEGMTQPGVLAALVHRGGLRADILSEGTLQVGDSIISLE
jgi:MOSC domain-containing protein YiiM